MQPDKIAEQQFETLDEFIGIKRDPRVIEAEKLYDETSDRTHVIKLFKTTRAGATTALSAESIRRGELLTLICRTNRVITETMKVDVRHHTAKYNERDIIHITRNSFCPKLMRLIKTHPSIERLGILPLPNCDNCEVSLKECPIKYAYETPIKNIGIYCITYAKLLSLMLSKSKRVANLLSKIFSSQNFIFDEAQYLQEAESMQVTIWRKGETQELDIRKDFSKKHKKLAAVSPRLTQLVDEVSILFERIAPQITELMVKSREERFKKHLSITLVNPVYKDIIEALERAFGERPDLIPLFAKEFGQVMKIQSLLMKAITNPTQYDLNENDIIVLSRLLFILLSKRVTVSYVKTLEGESISLQTENTIFYDILKQVLKSILNTSTEKRIIFTTATFGSFNLEALFGESLPAHSLGVENRIWGKDGDPIGTSDKTLIVADKAKVSPYNFSKRKHAIVNLILAIEQKYGRDNIQILTMNIAWAKSLLNELKSKGFTEEDITWYGSDKTEGVKSRRRIWVSIGLAEKPSNAKDHLAETQTPYHENPLELEGEALYHFISQKLRKESVHISTYQAISRAKDPNNKDRSLVIAIGATEKDVDDCITWGTNRQLILHVTKRGYDFEVSIKEPLSKPQITQAPLTADLEESMHIIDQWLNYGKVVRYKLNWIYLKKLVDQRGYISLKRLVNNYDFPEADTHNLLDELPQYLIDQGITDYVVLKTAEGKVKGVAKAEYYRKLTKAHIILNKEKGQISVVHLDWFIGLSSAVAQASSNISELSAKYFNKHVSSNRYRHVSDFFDALRSDPSLLPGWIVVGEKDKERETRRLIRDVHCLGSWVPDFPRRFGALQVWVDDYASLLKLIADCQDRDGFISVYSFPSHLHPKEGGNPPISTMFIDLDIESPQLSNLRTMWEYGDETVIEQLLTLRLNLLREVLKQAKAFVTYLLKRGIQPRILLSGFKGVHIFIDFPSVQFSSLEIAKHIIRKYLDEVKVQVGKETNVDVFFDSSVIGDVSRLCRIPNTVNIKATKVLGRPQYAVPITIEEIMNLTPEDYDKLCSSPRLIPITRTESHDALVMLTKITEDMDLDEVALNPTISVKDPERLENYERECTREILTDEGYDELNIRPCFKKVRREKISLDGSGGHMMRIGAVMELASKELSIPSIVRWFDFCLDYDPAITEVAVKSIISRGYTDKYVDECGREHRKGLRCMTVHRCGFCLGDACPIYVKKKKRWRVNDVE